MASFKNRTNKSLVSALIPLTLAGSCGPALAHHENGPNILLAQATPNLPATNAPNIPSIRNEQPPTGTILPTDVLPLPTIQNRMTIGENFQLRVLQRLPARFYMSASCESSFRLETNPYQFPPKRQLLRRFMPLGPAQFNTYGPLAQQQIRDAVHLSSREDMVFRVLPNVTAGWTLTPRTRLFANYFMIRDSLFNQVRLNTVIQSIAGGIQQDIPIGSRANLQAEFQFRELYQLNQQPVFDFLPGLTLSVVATPRTILFVNALLQMRGKRYFQAPTKEIDPFYTWGVLHQRNGWTFTASSTFVQNFREPFRHNATIPINNYAFILDFEVARRLLKQVPGLQAFVRAEPIYNFASGNTPGLAGVDFRLFWGLRMAMSKPALTATLDQLRQQLEEQEVQPPAPPLKEPEKPSAFIEPHEVIASTAQPIHGFLPEPVQNVLEMSKSQQKPGVIEPPHITARNNVPATEVQQSEAETEKQVKPAPKPTQTPSKRDKFEMVVVPPFPEVHPVSNTPMDAAVLRPAVLVTP